MQACRVSQIRPALASGLKACVVDALAFSSRPTLPAAKQLLESVALPSSDLTEQHLEHFLYCGSADGLAGLVVLEIYGPNAPAAIRATSEFASLCPVTSAVLKKHLSPL